MENMPTYKERVRGFRKRFVKSEFEGFTDSEIVEFILSYAAPNKDNSETAKKLHDCFGSLSAIMEAPYNMLIDMRSTESMSMLIKMIPKISGIYFMDKYFNPKDKDRTYRIEDKISASFIGCEGEQVIMVLFDSKGREILFHILSKGSVNASEIYIRKMIDICIRYNAASVLLAHNHPSGVVFPSSKDVQSTIKVRDAMRAVNVKLLNHLIVAGSDIFSMADNENYSHIFT